MYYPYKLEVLTREKYPETFYNEVWIHTTPWIQCASSGHVYRNYETSDIKKCYLTPRDPQTIINNTFENFKNYLSIVM